MVNIAPGTCINLPMPWAILPDVWSAPTWPTYLADLGAFTTDIASEFRARQDKTELMVTGGSHHGEPHYRRER